MFSMPEIKRNQNKNVRQEKEQIVDEEMPLSPKNLKVVEIENLKRVSDIFNFNQHELKNGYQDSIECY